jgi:hypothetical protein
MSTTGAIALRPAIGRGRSVTTSITTGIADRPLI